MSDKIDRLADAAEAYLKDLIRGQKTAFILFIADAEDLQAEVIVTSNISRDSILKILIEYANHETQKGDDQCGTDIY